MAGQPRIPLPGGTHVLTDSIVKPQRVGAEGTVVATDSYFSVDSKNRTGGQGYMRLLSKGIAWLCLLLTLSSAYSLAAHHHSNSIDAAKCAVCVAAHSASPVSALRLPNAAFVPLDRIIIPEAGSAKQRLIPFALSVRPPPEV